jgi:putative heme-binding domain-containing protein
MRNLVVLFLFLFPVVQAAVWRPLFNGRDLSGWSGDPRLWKVVDGVLTGETNDTDKKVDANTFLIWQGGRPSDFELEYKARVTGGNNSGVQYRSKIVDPEKWVVSGYQMDLHPDGPYLGMLYEERGRGIACQRGQRVELAEKPKVIGQIEVDSVTLSDWNTYRIVASGPLLRHYVNGKLAAEIRDVDAARRSMGGVIALQLHAGPGMKAEFKDLRWRSIRAGAARNAEPEIKWIWRTNQAAPNEKVFFRREFKLPNGVKSASITSTCDNIHRVWINGHDLGMVSEWSTPQGHDVTAHLKQGASNVIAVEGRNTDGIAAMALRFSMTLQTGAKHYLVSDASWQCSGESAEGWERAGFDASKWTPAVVIASMGAQPWGMIIPPDESGSAQPEDMTSEYAVAEGFQLERLYRVPKNQGSWVAMTVDAKGRLLCADQYGSIYRVTPAADGEGETAVVDAGIPIKGAHGLLWHEGVLWVTVNEGSDQAGVWRVTDTNGDGDPDKPELIKGFEGRGEHGPHALTVSPDGKWIYVASGNHTNLPEMDSSLVPKVWQEDQLLPRRPDARGHARDRMAPGGWVARFQPDGKNWQLFSIGFRNQYGLAFNSEGDLFTYDADMEWDLGMPWYRPTRINHVTPGSEFGWRNGTGKWPEYYEDSMPTQLDIGPGSPTGVVSGKGARFPEKYQRAVYALDWTFATMYAIHLTPDGAGYRAEREEFIAGAGLPLTDAEIGADGAMYFLTGGRRTDSALWRVTYVGGSSVSPVVYQNKPQEVMDAAAAVAAIGSKDRVARHNGRVALEMAGPQALVDVLKASKDPWSVISASIGLARTGGKEHVPGLIASLIALDWNALDTHQKINWLRAVGLAFARHGEPEAAIRQAVLDKIDAAFPAQDALLNRELCRLLSYLQAPGVVSRTLTLMDSTGPDPAPNWLELAKRNAQYGKDVESMIKNLPPAQVIHYVYCLRVVKGPWHPDERRRFFAWFPKLSQHAGGASYGGFINDLRNETLTNCTPEEREWISKLDNSAPPNAFANLPQIKGPGRQWTVDEVVKIAEGGLAGRDRENGRKMYQASLCAACHRFGGEGGAAGPDLTSVSGRFKARDLAEAILEPSKVVSDQYAFDEITRTDGTKIIGKIIEEKDEHWIVATSPFDFSQTIEIERSNIKDIKQSPVSPMPPALINRLNPDELKDLLAYLLEQQ